jgi:glutaredoxin
MSEAAIKVYGADWCPLTARAIEYLERKGIAFDYINIEKDKEAARWVRTQNNGKERKPTIRIGDRVLIEPTNQELDAALVV